MTELDDNKKQKNEVIKSSQNIATKPQQSPPAKIIGIDLGTTNSLVSFIKDGKPRIIPNERGSRATPSVVCFKSREEVIVGEMARNQAVLNAKATVSNVKLTMGTDKHYSTPERTLLPEEVSGFIINHLKECAEEYLQQGVTEAIITVPAYFNDNQRQATLRAAAMAGIKTRKLLNEPTAAALTYGLGSDQEQAHLLVIDLGGGTLDITLMEYTDKVFRVQGVGGSTSIGGINFDQLIIDHMLAYFGQESPYDLRQDPIAFQQLVIHAEKAKIDLSSALETAIMIPYIAVTEQGPIHFNQTLSRGKFTSLSQELLEDIEKYMTETFARAKLGKDWVDSVILVGGATRIPAVEEMVCAFLSPNPDEMEATRERLFKRQVNPDEAVARGAGILAGIFNNDIADMEFHDITSHNLGLEDDKGEFFPLITAGTTYPCAETRLFTTTSDNQTIVTIHIMQDKGHEESGEFTSLGVFPLEVAADKPKGEADIDVTFSIDQNGVLTVTALDLDSGTQRQLQIADFENAPKVFLG